MIFDIVLALIFIIGPLALMGWIADYFPDAD